MIADQTLRTIKCTTSLLASVGAINWGLIGLLDFNLVSALLGEGSMMTQTTYIIVGLSGIYSLVQSVKKFIQ